MSYHRTIHFSDTDAAGVVYFATLLSICHEAYEDALFRAGVNLAEFFSGRALGGSMHELRPVILPIVHAEIDFHQPLHCGDEIEIDLFWQVAHPPLEANHDRSASSEEGEESEESAANEFAIFYTITSRSCTRVVARASTQHVCIDRDTRRRCAVPEVLGACFKEAHQSKTLE